VRSTGKGLVFGRGRDAITVEVYVTTLVQRGKHVDQVTAKWNPRRAVVMRGSWRRLERWGGDGLAFDMHVERGKNQLKFDVVAETDAVVEFRVLGAEHQWLYTWRCGDLWIDLWDLASAGATRSGDVIRIHVKKGDVIDPLVWYDESAGLYQYDSINDFTPGMWTNGSTYLRLGDGVDRQSVYDWEIETWGSYVAGGGYAQWDFTLVNTREENEPGLTDNQTGSYSWCVSDDTIAGWVNDTGTVRLYTGNKVKGSASFNFTFTAASNIAYYLTGVDIDATDYDFFTFWMNGTNSGSVYRFYIYGDDGHSNDYWIRYDVANDFTGWRRFVLPLNAFDGMGAGGFEQDAIWKITVCLQTGSAETILFDRFLFDTTIPCPVELGVPDDTVQAMLYGYDGSGYHEYMRWEFNGSTYSWINPGALYWNGSNPAAAGRLAKQAAWGNYTWSGAPAGATKTPTQAAQTALNLSYWGFDLTRLMLQADYTSDKLFRWNEEIISDGNHPAYGTSNFVRGSLGTTFACSGNNVVLHRSESYGSLITGFATGIVQMENWSHDRAADTYSYEFYLDNDNAAPQNATIELYMPDNVTTYRVSYWNGSDYVTFIDYGSTLVLPAQSINGTTLDAAFYFNGFRNQTKNPVNATAGLAGIGPVTYSSNYGVRNRAAFTLELPADDGDAAGPDGADEAKLKVTVVYGGDGEATYEFEDSTNQYYGLQNINGNMAFLFNPDAAQPSGYLGVLFEEKPTALFVTADENQTITAFEFNVTGDWAVIDASYDTSATVTAVTGETISELSEYTGYYPDHAYYERGETGASGAVEGSTLVPATHVYQKPAGTRYMVAAKIPLPPYANGTASLSTAKLRAKVTVPAGAKYTARVDLSSPASAIWVATLFCDFQKNSYNIRPGLPMKNTTVNLIDPRTSTNWTFTYTAAPKLSPQARMDIRSLTVNGTSIPSKVIPLTYVTSGKKLIVAVELGYPSKPMIHSVADGNLTAVNWNEENRRLSFTMNRPAGVSTAVVDTGGLGKPSSVTGAKWSYSESTGYITLTIKHSSPKTVAITWGKPSADVRNTAVLMAEILVLIVFVAVINAFREGAAGLMGKVISYVLIVAALILLARLLAGWGW